VNHVGVVQNGTKCETLILTAIIFKCLLAMKNF
jgi:hypothetical protein